MPFQVAPFQQAIGQVSAPSRPGQERIASAFIYAQGPTHHYECLGLFRVRKWFTPVEMADIELQPARHGFCSNQARSLPSDVLQDCPGSSYFSGINSSFPYAALVALGGRLLKVNIRLIAKIVTAVISVTADTGSHDQAQVPNP